MDVDLPNILKRCLSAPIINNLATTSSQTTRATTIISTAGMTSSTAPQSSNSSSREASPAPIMNIFTPRARRYSASFASVGAVNATNSPCPTPRVSQLRQEECIDINSREINHEREVHSAMQISQSWEDLTIVAENGSCKSEDLSNPLQVMLPSGITSCSSPSPTSRTGLRLPYGLSPSPTRRTFATRRSMSPIAMRPSQLGLVKRKFELEDHNTYTCSPPPLKKICTESRGPSPICQSPSSICPSPDSGTYEGRITPKLFLSKYSSSSLCSSPMVPSPMMDTGIDLQSNNSSSPANTISSSSTEPTCMSAFEVDVDSALKSNCDIKSFNDETLMGNDKINEIDKTSNSREIEENLNCNLNLNSNSNENNSTIKESNFRHIISSRDGTSTERNLNIIEGIESIKSEGNCKNM